MQINFETKKLKEAKEYVYRLTEKEEKIIKKKKKKSSFFKDLLQFLFK